MASSISFEGAHVPLAPWRRSLRGEVLAPALTDLILGFGS